MNKHVDALASRLSVKITDDKHALILLMRTMRLDQMIYVMKLNETLPIELPNNPCENSMQS